MRISLTNSGVEKISSIFREISRIEFALQVGISYEEVGRRILNPKKSFQDKYLPTIMSICQEYGVYLLVGLDYYNVNHKHRSIILDSVGLRQLDEDVWKDIAYLYQSVMSNESREKLLTDFDDGGEFEEWLQDFYRGKNRGAAPYYVVRWVKVSEKKELPVGILFAELMDMVGQPGKKLLAVWYVLNWSLAEYRGGTNAYCDPQVSRILRQELSPMHGHWVALLLEDLVTQLLPDYITFEVGPRINSQPNLLYALPSVGRQRLINFSDAVEELSPKLPYRVYMIDTVHIVPDFDDNGKIIENSEILGIAFRSDEEIDGYRHRKEILDVFNTVYRAYYDYLKLNNPIRPKIITYVTRRFETVKKNNINGFRIVDILQLQD